MPNKIDKNELLKDVTESNVQNETLQKYVIDYIIKQFPIEGKTNTLELKEISLDASKIDPMDLPLQKEIKLKGGTWALPIYGSLVLRNNKTGEIIDESKKTRLLNLPIVTNRYSMIIDGSEYQTINQLRLKSGIYTRVKENGELESWFDLEKGYNFKMIFDPDTKLFYLVLANKKFKVYPILKALGFPDEDIKRAWGKEIYEENQRLGLNKDLKEIPELVEKLTKKTPANYEEAMKGLVDYLNYTKVDKETTKLTLGESFDKVSAETLFATSKKILGILRGTEKPDERDSLVFKNIYTPAALLGAFMDKKIPAIEASLRYRTDSKTQIKDIISSDTYTKPFKSFYTTGDLSSTPEQTNPISILNEWRKTTVMGTGGVKSDHAITLGVRDVHPSHFGFLDALGSPESGRVGVTLPLAVDVVSTDDNILRKQVVLSSGKKKYITPTEAATLSIAFPDQWVWKDGKPSAKGSKVNVMRNGEVVAVSPSEVDVWIENSWSLWSWPTNLVPFLPNNDAVRASFGSKMTSQAIALDQRESPNVESRIGGGKLGDITFEQAIGKYLSPIVPYELKKGVVTKITDDYIFIKPDGEKTEDKIGLFNNFPLNRETFLHSTPKVRVGDEVRAGDILAHLNFQDPKTDGLAYGLNVNVAYMPWKGMNYEDSCVITESLSKRMTSTKIITESLLVGKEGVLNLQKFRVYFPGSLTDKEASILDEEGVVKVGSWVEPNQIIIAYLEKKDLTDSERILRSMNKSMYSPFSNKSVVWHGANKAQVIYVNRLSGGKIVVHLKESSPMVVGDKLAGRVGNKSIVSRIIPDDEAPHTLDGKRIDLILSPNGIPGRMNVGQLLETAAGKIADKTGKKYLINNFGGENHLQDIQDKLKQYGLKDKDVLLDGKDGKPFLNPVFNGNQYILKLMHTVDHKTKSRSYGSYSIEEQPSRGDEGGQKVDPLSTFALLAHGARENLREFAAVKSQKNDEIWAAIQTGQPIPPPRSNFAFEKLLIQLKGVGINVNKNGNTMTLEPMIDSEILEMSNGKVTDAGKMLIGKNLDAIKGGIFDKDIFGGVKGKKWGHIELEERMPNPLYQKPIMVILGLTDPQFKRIIAGEEKLPNGLTGPKGIEEALRKLDVDAEFEKAKKDLVAAPRNGVNKLNQRVRYLEAIKRFNKNPAELYMLKYVPVMPPVYRPIMTLGSGDNNVAPINHNYRFLALANNDLKHYKAIGTEKEFGPKARLALYEELSNTVGLSQSTRPDIARKTEGVVMSIAGKNTPKFGYAHNKLWGKRQDLSGRSTITLDPSLGLDEVGLPANIYKKVFLPFAVREMVNQGLSPLEARQNILDDTPLAQNAFEVAMKNRPVLMNRAPSLHKHSIQAHIAKPTSGASIKLNPLIVTGYNADFDGDEQISTVIIEIDVEKLAKIWYNNSTDQEQAWFNIRKMPKEMAARFNVDIASTIGGEFFIVNLEDFPYDKNKLIGTKDHIDFYEARPGIKVLAYDEEEGKMVLAPVSGWSVHRDREVWTISLHNKTQIISDDDERAVYGVLPGTIDLTRKRPSDSIGMLVPYARKLEEVTKTPDILNIRGFGKLKDQVPANKETGYVLGALIGDGWIDIVKDKYTCVNLSGIYKSVVDQYYNFLSDHIFKERPHLNQAPENKTSYGKSEKWRVSSTDFAEWVHPLIGKGAVNKHLPPCWFTAPRDFKIGLLSGLLDTDGSISITHGKAKPQLQSSISSISLRMLQETQQLLRTLGVSSKISYSKKTQAGNDFWILSISCVDLVKIKNELVITHTENKAALNSILPDENSAAYVKTDLVPISNEIATQLMTRIGLKENRTLYTIVSNGRRNGYLTRESALKAYELRGDYDVPESWKNIIFNKEVSWTYVTEVENTGKTETGYDLTVPGYETFMSVDGVVLSNTMSVHVPVSSPAVEEAYTMLPSKNIWQSGSKTNIPASAFSKDYMLGLWQLTKEEVASSFSFKTLAEANAAYKADKIKMNHTFLLNGHRTSLGRQLVIKTLPQSMQAAYDKVITKKDMRVLLDEIAKTRPNDFASIIDALKDIALQFGHSYASTISLEDLDIDRSFRDKILIEYKKKEDPKWSTLEKANHWLKAQNEIVAAQNDYIKSKGKARGFFDMLDSGAESKQDSVRQIITMPGVKIDVYGKPLAQPIIHSYAEGLNQGEYWMSLYGARKGMVDRSINTEQSGAINKSLLGVTKSLLVVEADCGTTEGVEIDINDTINLMDRYLAIDIPGIAKAGELNNNTIISKVKAKKINTMWLRSPLTCETPHGICQKCYGIAEDGNLVAIGTNVGIKAGQSTTERACNHAKSYTIVDDNLITLEELFKKHSPKGTTIVGDTEIIDLSAEDIKIYDGTSYVKLNKIGRHLPTAPMMFIKSQEEGDIVCQANHPIPVYKGLNVCNHCGKKLYPSHVTKNGNSKCTYCGKTKNNSYTDELVDPIWKKKTSYNIDTRLDYVKQDTDVFAKIRKIGNYQELPLTNYWFGFYLAEGCINYNKGRIKGISIRQLHSDHMNKLAEEHPLYKVTTCEKINGKINTYCINNAVLGRHFEEISGRYSHNKHIPNDFINYENEKLLELLAGLLDGDGFYDTKRRVMAYSSNSYQLIQQIAIIGHILHFNTVVSTDTDNGMMGHQGMKIHCKFTKDHLDFLSKFSYKVKNNIDNFKIYEFKPAVTFSAISIVKPFKYKEELVYDVETESHLCFMNGLQNHNTQLTLKSFHSGGSAAAEQDVVAGFPRMEQLLKVPEILSNKATLASIRGTVHRIEKSAIGGHDVYISGVKHHIPYGRTILVKTGDEVQEGDALSSGAIKPQELATYKGYQAARLQIVKDLEGVFGKEGLGKRTFETVLRGIANQATVDEAPEDTEYYRGDNATLSKLLAENKQRRLEGKEEIKFTPYFKSIDTLALDNPDWLSKLTVNRIKETLKDGAALGAASNLHGADPMPSYLYGTEFNSNVDFSKGRFY